MRARSSSADPYDDARGGHVHVRAARRWPLKLLPTLCLLLCATALSLWLALGTGSSSAHHKHAHRTAASQHDSVSAGRYDAVVVPGGGFEEGTLLPAPWVRARLDAALLHDAEADHFLVLSRGTTHRPPPVDAAGHPVDEARASADYLTARGVDASRVLLESWSLDTIGNAAFARLMHAEPRRWRRLLVVTSAFHMVRTRAIFEWVFGLPSHGCEPDAPPPPLAVLEFEASADVGLSDEASAARTAKEQRSLEGLRDTARAVRSLSELSAFLFQKHSAYAAERPARPALDPGKASSMAY